jgi:hypothetical protein
VRGQVSLHKTTHFSLNFLGTTREGKGFGAALAECNVNFIMSRPNYIVVQAYTTIRKTGVSAAIVQAVYKDGHSAIIRKIRVIEALLCSFYTIPPPPQFVAVPEWLSAYSDLVMAVYLCFLQSARIKRGRVVFTVTK